MNHSGKPKMYNDYPNLCTCLICNCNRKDQCIKSNCPCCTDTKIVWEDAKHHV